VAYDVTPRVNLLQNKVNSIYKHCFAMHIVWLVFLAQSVYGFWVVNDYQRVPIHVEPYVFPSTTVVTGMKT
jgi:hypothetical protein